MYSIGKFSEICNIPVKTLRYYSDIGLLKPSYIDPVTNYRYYDYDKIQTLKKIKLLKSCHLSLATIKELIENSDQINWKSILEHKVTELEAEKKKISKQIEEMNRLKLQIEKEASIIPEPLLSDCFMEKRKELLVYTVREKINVTFIDQLVKKLFDRVYAFNLEIIGNLMAVFHERDLHQKEADVELLIPIKETNKIDGCSMLAGGTYACLTVKGPYSELDAGYEKLRSWLIEQNLSPVGNAFEIYEKGLVPYDLNIREIRPDLNRHPSEFITKICVRVTKNDH
ncbi:DNA-binding transcriptional MerR regulator [Bacillus thermophilus]|uniref:DNA-binding transcriptional MerR regulator n=1 Tax=Siminovitchia thermophila TaxID=1245522 RepID=A0ABS2R1A9_9BACI|nr:MerR family transcriptional regulator [Siminovitchia thermophila]MBM7713418.1 DNA-binding transcriptional MerR regulator [Siminovitchia thermophila]ONK21142.1 MerR family transcriptional regulator [Bacillus sp. VT-16-64]